MLEGGLKSIVVISTTVLLWGVDVMGLMSEEEEVPGLGVKVGVTEITAGTTELGGVTTEFEGDAQLKVLEASRVVA